MAEFVTVRMDPAVIAAAASAAEFDLAGMAPGDQARAMIARLAGQAKTATATAEGGAAPKRAGRSWERQVRDRAQERGFTRWDVGPLRGRRDLLDLTGCIDDGFLIGCKALEYGVALNTKMWAAMDQCHRAMESLPRRYDPARITPVQIIQRRGATGVGAAYAVTEFDWLLSLAAELRALRKD